MVFAAVAVGVLASCSDAPGGWVREQGEVGSLGGAEGILSAEDAGTEAVGDTVTIGAVGASCAANGDCVTDFCMTTENIGGFIKGAVIPGGYCSALFCAVDGSDGACTADMGGTCFSLFPFLGDAFGEQGICLSPCVIDADCRTGDDGICFDAQSLVTAGLIDAAVIAQYFPDGSTGCLPKSVADAAVAKLSAAP